MMKIYKFLIVVLLSFTMVNAQNIYENDNISIELISNTDNCLIECSAILKVCTKTGSQTLDNNNFNIWFEDSTGKETHLTHEIIKQETEIYYVDKPVYEDCQKEVCEIIDNKTLNEYCHYIDSKCLTRTDKIQKEKITETDFNPMLDSKIINDCEYIKLKGKKKPTENIDWKINIMDLKPNWAWWNSTYTYRYPIYNNHTTTEYPLSINDTGLVGSRDITWASLINDSFIYCEVSGCVSGAMAIANETNEKSWENETSHTGFDNNEVWSNGYAGVYHLTETNSIDSTVMGTTGTAGGNPTVVTGLFGNGVEMDGTGDYIDIDNLSNYITDHGDFTVEFWFKPTREWNGSIGAQGLGTHAGGRSDIWYDQSNGYFSVQAWDGSGEHIAKYPTIFLKDTWYYLVITFDSGTGDCKIYINANLTVTEANFDWEYHETDRASIGGDYDGNPSSYAVYDEYRFSNVTRDLAYIQTNYYNGIGNMTTIGSEETIINIDIDLFLNDTESNFYYLNNSYANFTSTSNVTALVNLTSNITGWVTTSEQTPYSNISLITCDSNETYYNMTAYVGNESYLGDSITHYAICYLPTVTTSTTTTTLFSQLGNYTGSFCSGKYLVYNSTIMTGNSTVNSSSENYQYTDCEYNCSETIFGSRCAYSPFVNNMILIVVFVLGLVIVFVIIKLMRAL